MDNRKKQNTKMDTKSNKRPSEEPLTNKKRLVSKTIIYDESKPNQWLDDPPLEIWDHVIIPMLGLKDLALARPVCTFFEAYWQDKFSKNVLPLRVGNDVATINQVMGVIEILSSRREYTKASPFVVLFGTGDHEVISGWTDPHGNVVQTTFGFTRSNITFIGNGIGGTTILGGLAMENVENITMKQFNVTNPTATGSNHYGIQIMGAEVELVDVAISKCQEHAIKICHSYRAGVAAGVDSQLVATRCVLSNNNFPYDSQDQQWPDACGLHINNNRDAPKVCLKDCIINDNDYGIYATGECVVDIHGDATAIYLNGTGIDAADSAKVRIHLPSDHNTVYNNINEDRECDVASEASITNVVD